MTAREHYRRGFKAGQADAWDGPVCYVCAEAMARRTDPEFSKGYRDAVTRRTDWRDDVARRLPRGTMGRGWHFRVT